MSSRSKQKLRNVAATATILVVEGDVLMRMVISDYLRERGYRVIEGAGSEEAQTILQTHNTVNAVLTAVRLSGKLDGFALAQWIRANYSEVDVVLATGPVMAAKKAGVLCEEGPIDQPYHPDQVVKRLTLLLERRRRTQR